MAATIEQPRQFPTIDSTTDHHRPTIGSTVWAVAYPLASGPITDERWVLVMGEVMGVRLDSPDWPHGQVWSTEELCRQHAWSRHVIGRRGYTGFDVRRLDVVTPTLFRLAAQP